MKLDNSSKFLKWYNDNTIAKTVNLPRPSLKSYLSDTTSSSESTGILKSPDGTQQVSISDLTSAQILAAGVTGYQVIENPGANKGIKIIDWWNTLTFVSAAYATNTTLQLLNPGSGWEQFYDEKTLTSTASRTIQAVRRIPTDNSDTQIVKNTAINLRVQNGNPTAGDGRLVYYIVYQIIDM